MTDGMENRRGDCTRIDRLAWKPILDHQTENELLLQEHGESVRGPSGIWYDAPRDSDGYRAPAGFWDSLGVARGRCARTAGCPVVQRNYDLGDKDWPLSQSGTRVEVASGHRQGHRYSLVSVEMTFRQSGRARVIDFGRLKAAVGMNITARSASWAALGLDLGGR